MCIMNTWTKIDTKDERTWPEKDQVVYWSSRVDRYGCPATFKLWPKYRWFKVVGSWPVFVGPSARGASGGWWRPFNDNDHPPRNKT